jgi:hypothetical protein
MLMNGANTVLVVEDDPLVRSYAVMTLESLGTRSLLLPTATTLCKNLVQVVMSMFCSQTS